MPIIISTPLAEILPAGAIMSLAGMTIPENALLCDGQEVNRGVYADLFAAIGTEYGVGDGSTTFNLPNLNDVTFRGVDDGRGADLIDPARTVGSIQNDAATNPTVPFAATVSSMAGHTHTGPSPQGGGHSHPWVMGGGSLGSEVYKNAEGPSTSGSITSTSAGAHTHTVQTTSTNDHTHTVSNNVSAANTTTHTLTMRSIIII